MLVWTDDEKRDWRGNEMYVGATVVWPTASGSNLYMAVGTIVGFTEKTDGLRMRRKIRVQPLESSRSEGMRKFESRNVRSIARIENVTVIP